MNPDCAMLTTLGALCLCLAGCGDHSGVARADVVPVRAMVVGHRDVAQTSKYSGEIRARHEMRLSFKVAGKIVERHIEVGSRVRRGQVLMRIDAQDALLSAQSALAQTEAAQVKLQQSRVDLQRYERLRAEGFVSKAALDQYLLAHDTAASQLRSALAQQRIATNQHAYTTLFAERDGVVTSIDAEAGQVVSVGQPVVTLAADGEREVLISIPEARVDELGRARGIRVSSWAQPERVYGGSVRELAPDADKTTRTYAARVAIVDPDDALRLGMTASVEVVTAGDESIHVPLSAMLEASRSPRVWVITPGQSTVVSRAVKVAGSSRDGVRVVEGLRKGEFVVTAGAHLLHEGQRVQAVEPDKLAGSAS